MDEPFLQFLLYRR